MKGVNMSKQNILSQIYGYSICLVTLLLFLFSVPSFVKSVANLTDVQHATKPSTKYLSFENYKSEYLSNKNDSRHQEQVKGEELKPSWPDDQALKKMYEVEKADALIGLTFQMEKQFFTRLFMMILSLGLFIIHWFWVRKITRNES